MPIPPLSFVDSRDAIALVREEFGCTGEEAVRFLCDKWIEGTIVPCFLGSNPPANIERATSKIDWFSDAIVDSFSGAIVRTSRLQRRATMWPGQRPEYDTYTERYAFKIDRRQLEALLKAAHATANPSDSAETGPAPNGAEDAIRTGEPTPYQPQSEKERLRRRVRQFLEDEAEFDPPRAQTKAEWQRLPRQELGDAVSQNLFDQAWQAVNIPTAWRAPGRRT